MKVLSVAGARPSFMKISLLNAARIQERVGEILGGERDREGRVPPLWDGAAADRIVEVLDSDLLSGVE